MLLEMTQVFLRCSCFLFFTALLRFCAILGVAQLITRCLPGALVETSKHQQLLLAEDHPVSTATRRPTGRPG